MFALTASLFGRKTAAAASKVKGAAAATAIAVDSSRFTTTAYTSGKTKTASLFKTSFLEDGADSFLNLSSSSAGAASKKKGGNNSAAAPPAATRRPRRKSPFALSSDAEKEAFARLVQRNMRALEKANAIVADEAKAAAAAAKGKKVTAKNAKLSAVSASASAADAVKATGAAITALAIENKAATGTTLSVMRAPQLASLKHKKPSEVKAAILAMSPNNHKSDFGANSNPRGAALLTDVILRRGSDAPARNRVRSKFYSPTAVEVRDGSFSVPSSSSSSSSSASGKKKASSSTTKSKAAIKKKKVKPDAKDALNPLNITANFFTSYERKQYSRLKSASLYLRDPRKHARSRARSGLYRMWDRVMEGLKPTQQ